MCKRLLIFLQIYGDNQSTTRRGDPVAANRPVYAHVRRVAGSQTDFDVQYWFFYPYNGKLWGGGAHEGDWEHVTVRVDATGSTMLAMYFAAHEGEGRWYSPDEVTKMNGRPVVFSAFHSHASYPRAGTWPRTGGLIGLPDDHTNGGPLWDTLGNLMNVGERGAPLLGQTWLNYSGRWGEIGFTGGECDLCFNGPFGPAFQDSWTSDGASGSAAAPVTTFATMTRLLRAGAL